MRQQVVEVMENLDGTRDQATFILSYSFNDIVGIDNEDINVLGRFCYCISNFLLLI